MRRREIVEKLLLLGVICLVLLGAGCIGKEECYAEPGFDCEHTILPGLEEDYGVDFDMIWGRDELFFLVEENCSVWLEDTDFDRIPYFYSIARKGCTNIDKCVEITYDYGVHYELWRGYVLDDNWGVYVEEIPCEPLTYAPGKMDYDSGLSHLVKDVDGLNSLEKICSKQEVIFEEVLSVNETPTPEFMAELRLCHKKQANECTWAHHGINDTYSYWYGEDYPLPKWCEELN